MSLCESWVLKAKFEVRFAPRFLKRIKFSAGFVCSFETIGFRSVFGF